MEQNVSDDGQLLNVSLHLVSRVIIVTYVQLVSRVTDVTNVHLGSMVSTVVRTLGDRVIYSKCTCRSNNVAFGQMFTG